MIILPRTIPSLLPPPAATPLLLLSPVFGVPTLAHAGSRCLARSAVVDGDGLPPPQPPPPLPSPRRTTLDDGWLALPPPMQPPPVPLLDATLGPEAMPGPPLPGIDEMEGFGVGGGHTSGSGSDGVARKSGSMTAKDPSPRSRRSTLRFKSLVEGVATPKAAPAASACGSTCVRYWFSKEKAVWCGLAGGGGKRRGAMLSGGGQDSDEIITEVNS